MADLPYPIDDTRTHWEGCYRERRHHNCAVVELGRLRAEDERLREVLKSCIARLDLLERDHPEVWDAVTQMVRDDAREALEDNDD